MEKELLINTKIADPKALQVQSWVSRALNAKLHPDETSTHSKRELLEINDSIFKSILNRR